jgi:hypothetical protein
LPKNTAARQSRFRGKTLSPKISENIDVRQNRWAVAVLFL